MGTVYSWVAGLLIGCLLLASCSVAKLDQKALERVQAKRSLVDKMVPVVTGLYPCVADTIAIVLPGGVDSVFYPVPVIDTVYDRGNAYAQGFADGQRSLSGKRFAKPRPDTVVLRIVDRQALSIVQRKNDELKQQDAIKTAQANEAKNRAATYFWWLVILIVLLVATNAYWIAQKFKPWTK